MSESDTPATSLIQDVVQILQLARQKAYSAVNSEMVIAYWKMGKRIVQEEQHGEQKAAYGEAILKTLSIALTAELGKGFSYANIRNFRQFFLTYPDEVMCYAVCSKLSWSHNRLIMRIENSDARAYYLKECANQTWSTRTLERNINSLYYQRLLSSQTKSDVSIHDQDSDKIPANEFIKDPCVFEFLNIPEPVNALEQDIEKALIGNLQQFLLELGKGFSFVGRQFRISTETSHFYIDLVFYNYLLKCFVLFDLKTGKLTHQDTGQMDMYIRMFDDLKKQDDDNPTIGIILCTEKDKTVVKYSILNDSKQLFATKYMLYLPTAEELIAEIEREKRLIKTQLNENASR
ncbi:PDDEXK nuclease domain-containing protein [Dyadobacter arcticus]|uniref:Nuclease of restriction endonuclease-like (RecB) superfamily n=1 Tax=Dyadobacter arcticus TaxID=1078754 RepID=A0ABX0UNN7_9BACT|nr:PDDEXK nuclease domain-containing protein [Dyadobacter arcticus]NIJ54603.1 putative nuclease of restriction endonuclease-like (RecB) superfamily [Dyadobacter arcticus]